MTCTGTTSYTQTGIVNYNPGIEAVSTTGSTRVFTLPPLATGTSTLGAITVGADGNLWFPEAAYVNGVPIGDAIDRMTPQGQVTRFPIPGLPALAAATRIPIKVTLAGVVQRSATQSIQVQTTPNAQIAMTVTYPVSGGVTTTGVASAQGIWQYSFAVTATTPGIAKVRFTVQSGGRTRRFSKQFVIL